jgi:serpin B
MKTWTTAVLAALSASSLACGTVPQPPIDAGPVTVDAGPTGGGPLHQALVLGPTNCSAPPSATAATTASVIAGNTQLALDLFGQLSAPRATSNLFFSPYSVAVAMEMTYAGAANDTATQMASVLHLPGASDVAAAVGALDCALGAHGVGADGGQLDIANRIFGQQGFPFQSTFLATQQNDYGAALQPVDFQAAPDAARQTINQWISDETEGMIPELLAQGAVTDQWRLALADALYFHGLWQAQFGLNSGTTAFHTSSTQTVQATTFSGEATAKYGVASGYSALELPFQDQGLVMDFLLPTAPDGLAAFEASLTSAGLSTLLGSLTSTVVSVELPKLHLDTSVGLVPTFEALGLSLPFTTQADFSGMDGNKDLSIAAIQHQAVLDMDELGATAAAATVVGIAGNAAPLNVFIADHPFVLLLRDAPTGTVLFMGHVVDPTSP